MTLSTHPGGQSALVPHYCSTSFLGRDEELAELEQLLEHSRLITLTGTPGIGKSRLAKELAARLAEDHEGGTALVELAPVSDGAHVPGAVAAALAIKEAPGESTTEALVAGLAERRLLLVLDNCEHLLEHCAILVETLLAGCPKLSVLATSREPLVLQEEMVWQLPPLPVPDRSEADPHAEPIDYPAVRLFVERAAAVEPGFSLNDYVAPAVAEICRRLDGIPLAIELAAARSELLSPPEIAKRLDDRFDLLVDGKGEPPRHRTLAAALDWSYELLTEPERAVLRRLSVFAGGFEIEACEAICSDGQVRIEDVGELLNRLAAKSLVTWDGEAGRHRLLETIRAYATDHLERSGEARVVKEAHAGFYMELAEAAEPELTGPAQQGWLERLDAERTNLRAALEWSLGHGRSEWALRLGSALVVFWRVRCHFSEGRQLLEAALSSGDQVTPHLSARALWATGLMTMMAGDHAEATALLEDCLARFRSLGDKSGQARALLILANCRPQDPNAASLAQESAGLAVEAGDRWCLSLALASAGSAHIRRGGFSTARPLLEQGIEVSREAGDTEGLRAGLLFLGQAALHQGDYHAAESLLEEALTLAEELRDDYSRGTTLQYLGGLALGRGEYDRARERLDRAVALLRATRPGDLQIALVARAWLAGLAGETASARCLLREAVTLALDRGDDPTPALLGMGELAVKDADRGAARRYYEDALGRSRALGIELHAAQALGGLAELAHADDDPKRAAELRAEALELHSRCGNAQGIVATLDALAGLAAGNGGREHAAHLFGAVEALREAHGFPRLPAEASRYASDLALLRGSLSAERLNAAFRKGSTLSLQETVALASKDPGRRGRPLSGWTSLSDREQEVAELVAEGLTNAQIAERLFIAEATVKAHVSNIFSKLGLATRSELAAEIWRRRAHNS